LLSLVTPSLSPLSRLLLSLSSLLIYTRENGLLAVGHSLVNRRVSDFSLTLLRLASLAISALLAPSPLPLSFAFLPWPSSWRFLLVPRFSLAHFTFPPWSSPSPPSLSRPSSLAFVSARALSPLLRRIRPLSALPLSLPHRLH